MTEMNSYSRNLRRVVLVVGTLLAVFFLLAAGPKLCGEIIGAPPSPNRDLSPDRAWEGQAMTATFLIFMVGYVIGWWRRLWGGLIMILAALVVVIPFIALARNYGSLIFGIPIFFVGLLYLMLFWDEKRIAAK
jgi:hypothetical protein